MCNLSVLSVYFSIATVFIFLLKYLYHCNFFPSYLYLLSFTVCGFTILYCPSTIFEITAGSSEKHFDKGRLNCDLRPTISYRNKEVKKLILFQIYVCILSPSENCWNQELKVISFLFYTIRSVKHCTCLWIYYFKIFCETFIDLFTAYHLSGFQSSHKQVFSSAYLTQGKFILIFMFIT